MPHHGNQAGYNQLLRHVPSQKTIWSATTRLGRVVNGASRRVMAPATGSTWYGLAGLFAEFRVALRARLGPSSLVHILYGEDLLGLMPRLAGPHHRVVATFHQPPQRFETLIRRPRVYARLDAVIVLDPQNAEHWQHRFHGPVYSLSLGLDPAVWNPGSTPPSGARILFVGNHLRDFDILHAVAHHFQGRITIDAVVSSARAAQLQSRPGLTVHHDITDPELRRLYRQAAIFFLPLKGASASNSLLQAMACGCAIVATDLPSVHSYVTQDCATLALPGDASAHIQALDALLSTPDRVQAMGRAARQRSLDFAWSKVGQRHLDTYRAITEDRR